MTQNVKIGPTQLLINGEFKPSVSGKTFATINPATETVIAEVAEGQAEDIELAVQAAREAFENGPWSQLSARERGQILFKWADLIEQHKEEIAALEVIDSGKLYRDTLEYDLLSIVSTIRYFAGWADKIEGRTIPVSNEFFVYTQKVPVGVCGLIIPWNFPLEMAIWKLAPCLAAGCTAILKPAEQTPLSALRAGELALEAGMPAGVLNIITGFGPNGAGEALVKHPDVDKIAFTGEGKTAEKIQTITANSLKRLSFELGGKSPNIILEDADLDAAVDGAFNAIFFNQGQNCCAGSRAFVHESIHDEFVKQLCAKAESCTIGDPLDPKTDHGPQVDSAQFDKILNYIEIGKSEGAQCVTGGKRIGEQGYFIAPTIFTNVTDDMTIAKEEIFGPVLSVLKFKTINEVIERANNTPFGLAGAVWSQNIQKAYYVCNRIKAGTVWINSFNVLDPSAPFGGFKQSGIGRELGEEALDHYLETKTVIQAL